MASSAKPAQSPRVLAETLLSVIEKDIVPLTEEGVKSGSKVFGSAVLAQDLKPITVATNNEAESPLWHAEINCIHQFFNANTSSTRPAPGNCVFLATHEPCSLCLSGIAWGGFKEFYFLFTYEDTRDMFEIPYDINILEEVFRVRAEGESDTSLSSRTLYNKSNKFFRAKSLVDLVEEIEDEAQKKQLQAEVVRVKNMYKELSNTYQEGKKQGIDTASVLK
ncbi:hypothetical protein MKZ38_004906 [Zalerion maritima]|uniref:CMP/dCMP-type deaminase domain-containing protein n=1 Tax=Zalerion maritima TaxID=339359 RepID=A0AAD5RXN8_9PEZI|nr:hypothetical protein MKZ38_004906 [Zalerion maritima]